MNIHSMNRPRQTVAQGSALFLTALLSVGTLPWCCLVEHHLHAAGGSAMSMTVGAESMPSTHETVPSRWADGAAVHNVQNSVCPWTHFATEISTPRFVVSGVVADGLLEGDGTPRLAEAPTIRIRAAQRLALAPPDIIPDLTVPPPRSV